MPATDGDLCYDPYDFETDPYPVWKRLREEQPLYYNERYDFYALSRFDDVERGLLDWRTYSSGKGSVLEMIKSGIAIPPGAILFEDPPIHDDVEHHGRVVPAGSVMLLLNGSANRDEREFPDADRFDIHRKIDHHLYGIYFCLGAAPARLEGRVALDEVLKRFPSWEVDWKNAVQARASTVRGWERLPVFTR